MDFEKVISDRTSIRKYEKTEISSAVLEKLVDAGRKAPSARGVEPWEFVIVKNQQRLVELSQIVANGSFIKGAKAAIIVFCKDTKYYLEDGCAATENILLAAAANDLGACWIAGDKKEYVGQVGEMFNADNLHLISIISLGFSAEAKVQTKKRSLENVIHWEAFKNR